MDACHSLQTALGDFTPETGLVLGSGLGPLADERIEVVGELAYREIEGFPVSTAPGHAGRFVFGWLAGRRVLCMQGRFHRYEGYRLAEVALPVRLMAAAGIGELVLTNAAGGINRDFRPGDFMLIGDHINFLGDNPLIGRTEGGGERFPDMTAVYDPGLRAVARTVAAELGTPLHEGVYLATTGPSFETPAEIRAFAALGADAVGMSTVPEAVVARSLGLRVLGISCISNLAAGLAGKPLSGGEVTETAERVKATFCGLVEGILARLVVKG